MGLHKRLQQAQRSALLGDGGIETDIDRELAVVGGDVGPRAALDHAETERGLAEPFVVARVRKLRAEVGV